MREDINCKVLPDGSLLLTAGNAARAYIREQEKRQSDISILCDLTEGYWANGSFQPFDGGAGNPMVGLTSAPCIAEAMNHDGQNEIEGRLWWFPDYALRSPIDELKRKGRTVFNAAGK